MDWFVGGVPVSVCSSSKMKLSHFTNQLSPKEGVWGREIQKFAVGE